MVPSSESAMQLMGASWSAIVSLSGLSPLSTDPQLPILKAEWALN